MVKPRKWDRLPVALPGGGVVPAMHIRDFAPMAVRCWRDAGGEERLTAILAKSDDEFMEVSKLLLKRSVPSQVEVGLSEEYDSLVKDMARERKAKTIDAVVVEAEDA